MRFSGKSLTGSVLKAMSVFTGVQAVTILCSVVRTKLVALWIGPVGVGLFAIFNNALDLISNTTQLNLRQSAVRDVSSASSADLPRIASVTRWWCHRLGIAGALLTLLASPWLSLVTFGDYSMWWGFALLSVAVLMSGALNAEQALMQGTSRFRDLARATVAGVVLATIASIPLYYFYGVNSVVPSILLFSIITTIVVLCYKRVKSASVSLRQSMAEGMDMIRLGIYFTVSMGVTQLASYVFLAYLTREGSAADTGIYQAGYTLVIRYTGIIFTALSMEYYPRLAKVATKPAMASVLVTHEMVLMLSVALPLLVIFIAGARLMIHLLYSAEFMAALPFVIIGAGAIVFRVTSYCMAYMILAKGDGRMYVVTESISAVIGLVLNILLYNQWSFAGLGVSYVLWYMIYTLIVGVVYYRRYGMEIKKGALRLPMYSVLVVVAAIALWYVGWWASLVMLLPAAYVSWRALR